MGRFCILFLLACLGWFAVNGPVVNAEDEKSLAEKRRYAVDHDRGIAYLRKHYMDWRRDPKSMSSPRWEKHFSESCLAFWVMSECGEDKDAQHMKDFLQFATEAAPLVQDTFTISIMIIALHRSTITEQENVPPGQPRKPKGFTPPVPLLARKLLAGQDGKTGFWGETCPHAEGIVDHYHTYWACYALWVARLHGIKTEESLVRAARGWRATQNPDGGWGQQPAKPGLLVPSTGEMTAAGLSCLAMGLAAQHDNRTEQGMTRIRLAEETDAQIQTARAWLAESIRKLSPRTESLAFFLFAVERTSTTYGWPKIGHLEMRMGITRFLMPLQRADGSWKLSGDLSPLMQTSFALWATRIVYLVGQVG